MSQHFKYYDDWRSATLECPQCHWKGTFNEGEVGYYKELMDSSCPMCSKPPILAIVNYATLQEMGSSGDPAAIRQADAIDGFRTRFETQKLKSKEQLPDLDAESFTLLWDFVATDHERRTLIKFEDRVLYSEPAVWEGSDRFWEVCKIVRDKYGARVTDLMPTPASEMYLYGDEFDSIQSVKSIRREVFGTGS